LDAVLFTACFDYCVGHGRIGECLPASGRAGNSSRTHTPCKDFLDEIRKVVKFRKKQSPGGAF
jgi:hypothetical protein